MSAATTTASNAASATLGQRKTALMLTTLHKRDRRALLARMPRESAAVVRRLLAELEAMPWPVSALADEVLAEEVRGLTARTSLELPQILELSRRLPAPWFARALAAWPGIDRNFCLSMLEAPLAAEVRDELRRLGEMPPKVADALKSEVVALLAAREAA